MQQIISDEFDYKIGLYALYPLDIITEYPSTDVLINICKSFENQYVTLGATFMGKYLTINDCNVVGYIAESIFYPIIKEHIIDFERGPKQLSPDYYGMNKQFEFELKLFIGKPGFDIGNFESYVNMLVENGGVYRKLFRTKYLAFEYSIDSNKTKIVKFHYLNVYNLVGYSGKHPISMQIKQKVWYNIRPCAVNHWYDTDKTPQMFIEQIVKCIQYCPHIENKLEKINSIVNQFNEIKLKYAI